MRQGLPWRNPVYNYSAPWEQHYRTKPVKDVAPPSEAEAIKIVTKVLDATFSEIQSEQRKALAKLGMKDRIITELQLTRDEAQSLLRPKRVKPRRSRRLTGFQTRVRAR